VFATATQWQTSTNNKINVMQFYRHHVKCVCVFTIWYSYSS